MLKVAVVIAFLRSCESGSAPANAWGENQFSATIFESADRYLDQVDWGSTRNTQKLTGCRSTIVPVLLIRRSVSIISAATVIEKQSSSRASTKKQARLRVIGTLVLLLGAGGAGMVYWAGTHGPDHSDDLSMVGYNRAQARQMSRLYGRSGLMVDDLINNLKRPGVQAALIATAASLFALGCFYIAHFQAQHDEPR